MLRTDLIDHRGTDDATLLRALAEGDAIALAEAYHRTVTAAHACARRLLASPVEIEALMRAVYSELWEEPPVDAALEGWIRGRCFNLGAGYLRQRNLRAPSSSLAVHTSGVDADAHHSENDPLERMISELTPQQQEALVRAHDQGIRTADQDDAEAGWSLLHALLVLASPLTDDERHAAEMCSSGVALANWMFGLLPPHEAATVPGTAAEPTPCGRLAGVLRRARRRFEPLPPTPDLGHRVLASVLAGGASQQSPQSRASRLDSDLRVAYADLDRSRSTDEDLPPSSLDMTLPSPATPEVAQAPNGLPSENGRSAPRWDSDGDDDLDEPTPLRAPARPSALGSPSPSPAAFGNAAPALAPSALPDPDEPASDDLVRMPLRRTPTRPPLVPADDADTAAMPPLQIGDRGADASPALSDDEDTTLPPTGLRRPRGDDAPRHSREPAGGFLGLEPGDGPAASPLPVEQRGGRPDRDLGGESPLRRPAPQARSMDAESPVRPVPPPRGLEPPPRGLEPPPRGLEPPPRGLDSTARSPIIRDDSDPRIGDMFGSGGDVTSPPTGQPSTTSTAALPSARRPVAAGSSKAARPGTGPMGPGPMSSAVPEPETSTGANILRWVVVLLLIALGAAFGIWLGQMLIG